MSLHVNLSSPDIANAYQDVLSARGIDWVVLTYKKASKDLKVQSTGNGLEDLEEEFSGSRIQYVFSRVMDPNTKLPKFVQINWCGDSVPEAKKGLFHMHSSAVTRFFRGTHVVINARNESDVTPSLIMSRVESASGARYSAHNEQAGKFEPIAPVGTNYTPVGKVDSDIAALRSAAAPTSAKPTIPSVPRPSATVSSPSSSGPTVRTTTVGSAAAASQVPAGSWDAPRPTASAAPPPPPAAPRSRPTVVADSRPVPAQAAPSSNVPTRSSEDDRIGPVGTAYTPVSLPPPKMLNNPFEARAQATLAAQPTPPRPAAGSGGKSTWSERQAFARKRANEEGAASSEVNTLNPDKPTTCSIPKGLTIGYDHWADMTPEGMARAALRNDGSDDYRQLVAEAMPNATEEETIKWLKVHFEGILSSVPIVVNAAHPKADDDTVQYTVIPVTPWGKLTIRWWADPTFEYCFDLVDIEQRKIRAIPKDLQFVLTTGSGRGAILLETFEEGHRLANLGPGNARVVYSLNADGIVEERYAVPRKACLKLCKRGSNTLIALVIGPEATYVPGSVDVPVYYTFPPV